MEVGQRRVIGGRRVGGRWLWWSSTRVGGRCRRGWWDWDGGLDDVDGVMSGVDVGTVVGWWDGGDGWINGEWTTMGGWWDGGGSITIPQRNNSATFSFRTILVFWFSTFLDPFASRLSFHSR